jgi:hypothetical protein
MRGAVMPLDLTDLELATAARPCRAVRSPSCSIGIEISIGTRESLMVPEWNPD